MEQSRFLTAEWRKLIMANYPVDPALLRPYLPAFTVLDEWEVRTWISLVGFFPFTGKRFSITERGPVRKNVPGVLSERGQRLI